MLVTTAMSVHDVQNITAVINMPKVLPETILGPIQICACANKSGKVSKNRGTYHKTQMGAVIALKFGIPRSFKYAHTHAIPYNTGNFTHCIASVRKE